MRHQKYRHHLQRPSAARKALLRGLASALINNGRIVTTVAKAKALRGVVEPLITLGKKGDLNARRNALKVIPNKMVVKKLFNEIAPEFKDRNGGYTRILKLTSRLGDAAPMAIIELVNYSDMMKAKQDKQSKEADLKESNEGAFGKRLKDKIKGINKSDVNVVDEKKNEDVEQVEQASDGE